MEVQKNTDAMILALEKEMLKQEQVDTSLEHLFFDGIYIRQLIIPADTLAVGKRHRFATCNILVKGSMALITSDGGLGEKVEAPFIFKSEPFVKKMAYTFEECVFLNILPTDKTDLDDIEEEFIITEEEYEKTLTDGKRGEICLT